MGLAAQKLPSSEVFGYLQLIKTQTLLALDDICFPAATAVPQRSHCIKPAQATCRYSGSTVQQRLNLKRDSPFLLFFFFLK